MGESGYEQTRETLITEIRGHRYVVPQRDIEGAVREWLERRKGWFLPLDGKAEWNFEWHDTDDGNCQSYLVVEHLRSKTTANDKAVDDD